MIIRDKGGYCVATNINLVYPPIVNSTVSAFLAKTKELTINFSLPLVVKYDDIKHIAIKIVQQSNNKTVVNTNKYWDGIIYTDKPTSHINGIYSIKNKETERYIDIDGSTVTAGTLLEQQEYDGGSSQLWRFTHLGDGSYSIKLAYYTSNYYMGVKNDSTANNTSIVLRTGSITAGMRWIIEKSNHNAYKIIPKTGISNNRVLAVGWYVANVNGIDIEHKMGKDHILFYDQYENRKLDFFKISFYNFRLLSRQCWLSL